MATENALRMLRARALDEDQSLAGLLRACLMLGAETHSEPLRAWASRELNGYDESDTLPPYRKMVAPLVMNSGSGRTWATGQQIRRLTVPAKYRILLPEELSSHQPIDELEPMLLRPEGESLNLTLG